MQNKNTNLKIINNNGGRVTNHDLLVAINKINARLEKIESRIDNLVSKNNLKE